MVISPAFAKIQKDLNTRYGNVLRPGQVGPIKRLPTGYFNIDWGIGGGIPANRMLLVNGHKSCYKTTLLLRIIASYQSRCSFCLELIELCNCGGQFDISEVIRRTKKEKRNKKEVQIEQVKDQPDILEQGSRDDESKNAQVISGPLMAVYIDSEHVLDVERAAKLGVIVENLHIFDPPHGEAACEYAEKFAQLPEVGIIIVDSLAGLVPESELEKGYFDPIAQSLRARLIARMYRAVITHLSKPGLPPRFAVCANHLLPNRSGYGDYLPGGETQKYLSAVCLKLWTTKKQYMLLNKSGEEEIIEEEEDALVKTKKVQTAEDKTPKFRKQTIGFLVEHSKVSSDLRKGEVEIYLENGNGLRVGDADDFRTVFFRAMKTGIIEKNGKGWVLWGVEFDSYKAIRDLWVGDRVAYERVKKAVFLSTVQGRVS